MNKGYSKQSAFNVMKGLAKKNYIRNQDTEIKLPSGVRYLVALVIEFVLFAYKVPSKKDAQIMLIQTIIPLSEATKPLAGIVTLIALLMQIASLLLIYDLIMKLYKALKRRFRILP